MIPDTVDRSFRVLLLIVAALVVTGVAQAGPPGAKVTPTQKPKASAPSGRVAVEVPAGVASTTAAGIAPTMLELPDRSTAR